ncbi:MAG: hypothetical protein OSJ28_07740 [Desulfovibrio sp.]|nr:hypothetical protein [Desulfovibrio sp.]
MQDTAVDFFSAFAPDNSFPAEPEPMPAKPMPKVTPAVPTIEIARAILSPYRATALDMERMAANVSIKDSNSNALAVTIAGQIKKTAKKIEDARKNYVSPFNAHVKDVNALAAEIRSPLERAEKDLKKKLNAFAAQQELERRKAKEAARKRAQEEQERLNREAAAAGVEAPTVPEIVEPEESTSVRTAEGTAYLQNRWTFELEDLAMVPADFLMLDEKKVRAAIKAGVREIPGLKIFEQKSMVIRG